jgi:NAD-dependent dihydropyrimidine dehydrogenase PreA subunit
MLARRVGQDMKTVFINPDRCIGCLQCELAGVVEYAAGKDEKPAFPKIPLPSQL